MSYQDTKLVSNTHTQRSTRMSADRLWDEALEFLQAELPRASFDTWVRHSVPLSFDGHVFAIGVANSYTRQWLVENILDEIQRTLSLIIGQVVEVHIIDQDKEDHEPLQTKYVQSGTETQPSLMDEDLLPASSSNEKFELLLRFRRYWEEIVNPEKVVSISRYYVKYWLPILGPNFSSIVLAFKQIRYLHQVHSDRPFEVGGSEILRWLCVDETTFYRHLNQPHPLLSWFVEKAPSVGRKYERVEGGKVRRKPRKYIVYGGIPLAPPHQGLARRLLVELGAGKEPADALSALEKANKIPDAELEEMLDQSFDEYMTIGDMQHPKRACTVLDIIRELIADREMELPIERIAALAEEFENRLVRPDRAILLTWYFIQEWQPLLSSGAFWLIILLRSRGYYDKRSAELRDVFWVNGGYAELGSLLGISSETISGWLGQNRKKSETSLSSHMELFIKEIERSRGQDPRNGRFLSVKFRVEMLDPLNPEGERRFIEMVHRDNNALIDTTHFNADCAEISQFGETVSQEICTFGEGDSTEINELDSIDSPEKCKLDGDYHPEFNNFGSLDHTEKRQRLDDSKINHSEHHRTFSNKNTSMSTTTPDVNQLILPMIYTYEDDGSEKRSGGQHSWNLEELLASNNLPPGQMRELQRSGARGRDFAAWVLYAYSQEGRGIQKPGFFAAKRLLEKPPILAQEKWSYLADLGPGFVYGNIRLAMDPVGEDVDREWRDAMGKVSRERLKKLACDLGLESIIEDSQIIEK